MAITDIPLFSMLRTRMHWHQERQRLLAENVANADSAKCPPRDLAPPQLDGGQRVASTVTLARTDSAHIAASQGSGSQFQTSGAAGFNVRPSGNAVNLEDEMIKVASNQMDY